MVDFQDWITKQIDAADMTKRELAERAGISASLVYAVTTEGRKVSADFCVRVAPILGIPTLELLRRAGFSTLPPPDATDPILAECWRILNELTPDERGVVVRMLRGLVSE